MRPLSREAQWRVSQEYRHDISTMFAEHRGASFLDDYHRLRLEHADRLLRKSALSISEIAFTTGYSSNHCRRATIGVDNLRRGRAAFWE